MEQSPKDKHINDMAFYTMRDFFAGGKNLPTFVKPAVKIVNKAIWEGYTIRIAASHLGYNSMNEFDAISIEAAQLIYDEMDPIIES